MNKNEVNLKLTSNEALALVNFLLRFRDDEILKIEHPAEEQLLWDLCAMLESEVPELLDPKYYELVAKAHKIIESGSEIE